MDNVHANLFSSLLMQPVCRCDTTASGSSHNANSAKKIFKSFFSSSFERLLQSQRCRAPFAQWVSSCRRLEGQAALLFSYQQPSYIIASMQRRTERLGAVDSGAFLTLPPLMGCWDMFRTCFGAMADGGLGGDDEVVGVRPVFDTCLRASQARLNRSKWRKWNKASWTKAWKGIWPCASNASFSSLSPHADYVYPSRYIYIYIYIFINPETEQTHDPGLLPLYFSFPCRRHDRCCSVSSCCPSFFSLLYFPRPICDGSPQCPSVMTYG